jgi:hypothetical protein
MSETAEEIPYLRLTRLQLWGFLGIAVAIFLFASGPVWEHPWDISALNRAIFYSYAPIPVLVLVGLAYKRRLGARAFVVDLLVLTLLKYSITFGLALVMWSVQGAPPPAAQTAVPSPRKALSVAPLPPAPAPTPVPEEKAGVVRGVVVDREGKPVAGALAYIAAGLEAWVFAPPPGEVALENRGAGIEPAVAIAQLRQPIAARSTDGHLHTFIATQGGTTLLNLPLLSSGVPTPIAFTEAHGLTELRCSVHQHLGTERSSTLLVLTHPFSTITGEDGRFTWSGVPAGALRLAAWDSARGTSTLKLELTARGATESTLTLAPPAAAPSSAPPAR